MCISLYNSMFFTFIRIKLNKQGKIINGAFVKNAK